MELNIIYTILIVFAAVSATFIITKKKISKEYSDSFEKYQKEIALKKAELEYLKEKQTKFWDVISNQLRKLFYSFYNSIDLLNNGYDELTVEEKKELIASIGKSYDQSLGIINELLEWVKANRRRQNSTPEYINLSSLLNDNISFLNSRINEKNLTVDKKIGENIPIRCDKMMIDFVIKSILGNAIKFSHKESIIRIECSKVGNRAEMIISDSGIGIPKENLEKLFKLDEIISTAGTANEKGSGLGLIICRDFLELNNGKLSINSEFGKGTTVTVVLEGTDNWKNNNRYCNYVP